MSTQTFHTSCIQSTARRLCALESYGFTIAGCAVLATLENWRNESPTDRTEFFRSIARTFTAHFDLNRLLAALLPRESLFKSPIEERSERELHCFKDTHNRVLQARDELLPWLLMATYSEHPPTAAEAYRFLKLHDIQRLLEKIASVLDHGTRYVDYHKNSYLSDFLHDQEQQLDFLLNQLPQYGIEAENYAEAAQQYVKLLDSIFPASAQANAPKGEIAALVSNISDEVGL